MVSKGTISALHEGGKKASIKPYLGDVVVGQMSLVGSAVLMLIAFDMWEIRKFNVANLIPAAFMPLVFSLVQNLF